jgi:YegS/Rv2252/BmrU family lipid kinase
MKSRLIYNPLSGQRDLKAHLLEARELLVSEGWSVEWFVENHPQKVTALAKEAALDGYDVVIAAGGDGTISRVVNGLARTETALGVLPTGTGNVWAQEMGIPVSRIFSRRAILEAAEVLLHGEVRQVDLGTAGEHFFLMWAGIGLDAKITEEVRHDLRRQMGNIVVWVTGVQVARRYAGTRTSIAVDGQKMSKRMIFTIIGNAQLYGGLVRITPVARMDDGLLDVCIFKGKGFPATLGHLVSLFSRHHMQSPRVEYYQGESVLVNAESPLPVHLDGDPMGHTPMTFGVAPKALRVLLPSNPPERLFISQ